MSKNEFKTSKENYSETVQSLEKLLETEKLKQKEIMMAKLLLEEIFIRFENFKGDTEKFSADISIKKRFGDLYIIISAKGIPYNPLNNLYEVSEDDEDYFNAQILRVNINQLSYSRKNGRNVIAIKVHESDNKTIRETLAALVIGVFIGIFLKTFVSDDINLWITENIIDSLQTIFINVLMLIVAPMIFFSIIDGIVNMSDATYIERIGWRLILISLLKLAFYVALGLLSGFLVGGMPEFLPMLQSNLDSGENIRLSIRDLIVNIIPSNTVEPFTDNNILQLLFLACFFGIMLNRASEYSNWAREGVKFLSRFTIEVIGVLNMVIPFLVAVSMIKLMLSTGLQGILTYVKIITAAALGLPICFLISALLIALIGKIFPVPFLKKAVKFSILPFSLSSSNACLPATLDFCSNKLGMDEKLTKFTIPVGMQFNMDGTAFYVAVVSMMLAQTFEITMDVNFLLTFFLIEFFMALTGIGLIIMPPMLGAMGIPETAVAYFIGIEPVMDMFGTAQSVIGNITSSFIVTRMENRVNTDLYEQSQ